jgi:OFA family oxalate/formate antiporter-like MFS transporter
MGPYPTQSEQSVKATNRSHPNNTGKQGGKTMAAEEVPMSRWWRVVGGLCMNIALGSLYAWSVFAAPLEEEFGWKRADTTWVYSVAIAVFALSFIVGGRLQDKLGPFRVSVMGSIFLTLGFLMCARTTNLIYLIICFGVLVGLGNGFGYSTPIPVMAKWFPDKRGLAVGLAVAGFGAGSAIFGPLSQLKLIPMYGWRTTFTLLGIVSLVMTMIGAFLLKNPPAWYRPAGWSPAPASKAAATTYEFTPGEMTATSPFYFMWIAFALGCSAGMMVISQLVPFAKSKGIAGEALTAMSMIVGALGSALGRIFSGWISDKIGRLNVLRLMIALSIVAMPMLYLTGGTVAMLYIWVFVVYWGFGTQLSVNASTSADFWGTKNAGINYGLLFTAYGVAGIIGPRIGSYLFDLYKDYKIAFYSAAVLLVIALVFEMLAKRPQAPTEAKA